MRVIHASLALLGLGLSAAAFAGPVDVVLRLQERVPMATLAQSVTDPASARYRNFYTPAEIRELAGPSDSEYQALLGELQAKGMTVVSESPTHLFLTVRGEQALFEQHFAAKVETVAGLRKLKSDVTIPDAMHLIVGVTGLDNSRRSFPHLKRLPLSGHSQFNGIPVAQIRSLYSFDHLYQQGVSGAGQDLAIASYDDINLNEVREYWRRSGISPAPSIDRVTFNGTPKTNLDSAVETETDAEFAGALAPGASIHVFTSVTNDDAGEEQVFTAIIDDNRSRVVNYSWGGCESDLTASHRQTMDALFQRAVAQGINITVASGDSGSSCQGQDGKTHDPMADWPAAHPSVVAVGGTTVDLSQATLAEAGWSGSGGGISTIWARPTWQYYFPNPYNMRSYPDVSFNADPQSGQATWVTQKAGQSAGWLVIGGTSIAAPQWAAFLTLVGEARARSSEAPVGYINPIIYNLSRADRLASFDDILQGSNGVYSAQDGWNAVTGWGGLHADGLADVLAR